ncbi:MAG: lysylphosphatidylglycerol synthase domain-containing protein [Chitinophagales bacterium]
MQKGMAEKKELVLSTLGKYMLKFAVVALCAYIIYEQFSHLGNSAAQRDVMLLGIKTKGYLLAIAFLLMPLNWFLETKKWQILLAEISFQPFFKLLKAVLQGVMVGTVTPWRMGEFVGRTFELERSEAAKSFYFSALGGMAQAFVTALVGLFFLPWFYPSAWLVVFSALVCSGLLVAYFFFHKLPLRFYFFQKKAGAWLVQPSFAKLLYVLLLSLLRYGVYLTQWILVAYTFAVHDNILFLAAGVAVTLLFQSISPALPFFDLAVRSGISLFVFANISSNPIAVLLSTITIWLMNIAIPAIIGIIFFIKNKWWATSLTSASQANVEHFHSK